MNGDFGARLTRTFRVRSAGVRQVYHTWRRVERFFKDSDRRTALQHLPHTKLRIDRDLGFHIVYPGVFGETDDVVLDARHALATVDASAPPTGKNRKRFLQNVVDASTLTCESAAVRF